MPHFLRSHLSTLAIALLIGSAATSSTAAFATEEGDLVSTFGDNGVAQWLHSEDGEPVPAVFSTRLEALAATDTRLYAAGRIGSSGGGDLAWQMFDSLGEPRNQGCSQESETLFPAAVRSDARAAMVDAQGRLLVGGDAALLGSESQSRALLARFRLDVSGCALDSKFSGNGSDYFDDEIWCDTEDCVVDELAEIDPKTGAVSVPRAIALVRSPQTAVEARLFLLALTDSGAPDPDFSVDGWREIAASALGTLGPSSAMAIDGHGRIVVLVTRIESSSPLDRDLYLVRYSSVGVLDSSIGTNGFVKVEDAGPLDTLDARALDLEIDASGVAVVTYATQYGTTLRTLDLETGESFWRTFPNTSHSRLAAEGDERTFVVDDPDSDGFEAHAVDVVRDPISAYDDPSFQTAGLATFDVDWGGSLDDDIVDVLLWNGRLVIGGVTQVDAFPSPVTASFLQLTESHYVFADGFEEGTPARWSAAPGLASF